MILRFKLDNQVIKSEIDCQLTRQREESKGVNKNSVKKKYEF